MKIQNKKIFYGELSDLCECVPGSPLEKHSFRRMKLSLWVSPVGRAGCVLSVCAYVLWLFAEVATNPPLLVIHTMTVWPWVPPLPQKVQLASPSFPSGWPLTSRGTRCDASRDLTLTRHWVFPSLAAPETRVCHVNEPSLAYWRMTATWRRISVSQPRASQLLATSPHVPSSTIQPLGEPGFDNRWCTSESRWC